VFGLKAGVGLMVAVAIAQPYNAQSASRQRSAVPSAEVQACLQAAANKHGVAYEIVRSIAEQESHFNPKAQRAPLAAGNRDGSTDYGLMQINSSWLPTLARYGITKQALFDPCINADVGVWILADLFKRFGPTWKAVGKYNAVSPNKGHIYAKNVYLKLQRYVNQGNQVQQPLRLSNTRSTSAQDAMQTSSMGVWEQRSDPVEAL
jgi:soluble lytic murein transglycosylase-like protein